MARCACGTPHASSDTRRSSPPPQPPPPAASCWRACRSTRALSRAWSSTTSGSWPCSCCVRGLLIVTVAASLLLGKQGRLCLGLLPVPAWLPCDQLCAYCCCPLPQPQLAGLWRRRWRVVHLGCGQPGAALAVPSHEGRRRCAGWESSSCSAGITAIMQSAAWAMLEQALEHRRLQRSPTCHRPASLQSRPCPSLPAPAPQPGPSPRSPTWPGTARCSTSWAPALRRARWWCGTSRSSAPSSPSRTPQGGVGGWAETSKLTAGAAGCHAAATRHAMPERASSGAAVLRWLCHR